MMYINFLEINKGNVLSLKAYKKDQDNINRGLPYEMLSDFMSKKEKIELSEELVDIDEFTNSTGIKNVCVSYENSLSTLSEQLSTKLIQQFNMNNLNIKPEYIFYCSDSIDSYFSSSPACKIHETFKNKQTISFSISQVGSNSVYTGIELAFNLITSDQCDNIILICATKMVFPIPRFINNLTVHGDSGSIMCLSEKKLDNNLCLKVIGINTKTLMCFDIKKMTKNYNKEIIDFIEECMFTSNFTKRDVNLWLPPSLNINLINSFIINMDIDSNKVYIEGFNNFGNLSMSDLSSNIKLLYNENKLIKGSILLGWNISLSGNIGVVILKVENV